MVKSIRQKGRTGSVAGFDVVEEVAGMLAADFGEERHSVSGQLLKY